MKNQKKKKRAVKPKARPVPAPVSDSSLALDSIVYDTLGQAAAQTKIPKKLLSKWKNVKACDGFRGGRIYLGSLLRWVFNSEIQDNIDWGARLTMAKAKREEVKLRKERREVLDWSIYETTNARATALLFEAMERIFLQEQPGALCGLTESQIKIKNEAAIAGFKTIIREQFEAMERSAAEGKDVNEESDNEDDEN